MKSPANLVLIGMPASGKSTIGVLVAKVLGFDFLDTDVLLQKREGLRLHEILAREGATGFLAMENLMLSELEIVQTVVSTGGSAIYHRAGMTNLKARGRVVWIDVPYEEIERRLGDIETRGVVLGPGQTLRDLYEERRVLYQSWADQRLAVGREDLEVTVGRLAQLVADLSTPGT